MLCFSDGAPVMLSDENGAATKLEELLGKPLHKTHCEAHRWLKFDSTQVELFREKTILGMNWLAKRAFTM